MIAIFPADSAIFPRKRSKSASANPVAGRNAMGHFARRLDDSKATTPHGPLFELPSYPAVLFLMG